MYLNEICLKLLNAYKKNKIDKTYLQNSIDVIITIKEYKRLMEEIRKIDSLKPKPISYKRTVDKK